MEYREFWSKKAQLPNLRGVIDFNDEAGYKNNYIDILHKEALSQFVKFNKNQSVLDFGCGYGRLSKWAADKVKKVIGIDSSEGMIERARSEIKKKNASFLLFDGEKISFNDGYFDVVLSVGVLQHIIDDDYLNSIVRELARVLHPKGNICIIEGISQLPYEDGMSKKYIKRRLVQDYLNIFGKNNLMCASLAPVWLVSKTLRASKVVKIIQRGKVPIPLRILPFIAKINLELNKRRKLPENGYAAYLFLFRKGNQF